MPASKATAATAYLLPAYDEYTVAYKDRSALLNSLNKNRKITGSSLLSPTMFINGQVVGTWRRTLQKGAVIIGLSPFRLLKKAEKDAFVEAAQRYGALLGLPEQSVRRSLIDEGLVSSARLNAWELLGRHHCFTVHCRRTTRLTETS